MDTGRTVLVVNTVTRQIGTLTHEYGPAGPRRLATGSTYAGLAVVELDQDRGLLTPTMRAMELAEERERLEAQRLRTLERLAKQNGTVVNPTETIS